jgi:hypothetical protein
MMTEWLLAGHERLGVIAKGVERSYCGFNGTDCGHIIIIICGSTYEPGSSVSIVSVYWLDDRAIEVRSPAEEKRFFL